MYFNWIKELNKEIANTPYCDKKPVRVKLKRSTNNKVTKKIKVHVVAKDNEPKKEIKLFKQYYHFKGGVYIPIHIATHTETNEKMVVYVGGDSNTIWVRPLSMWFETVIGKEGYKVSRFTLLEGED